MKDLALIQVATLGAGYEAVQMVTQREGLDLLEFIPLGKESQLLLLGQSERLLEFRRALRTADLQKSAIILNPRDEILRAYYHQENNSILDFILILESEFAGYLLEAAQALLSRDLRIVDFRQPRFSGAISSLVLTGADVSRLEALVSEFESNKWKISFVESPTPKMKAYFEIKA